MVCSSPCFTATPDAAGCHGVVDRDAPTPRVGRRLLEHAVRRCMGRAWSAWIAHTGCLHATGLAAALWHARTRSHAHSHASTNLRPASNRGDSHEDFLNVKCRMTLLVTDENGGFKQRAGSLTISSPALHGKGEADRSEQMPSAKKTAPHAAPHPGLRSLRRHLQRMHIPCALAGALRPGWIDSISF